MTDDVSYAAAIAELEELLAELEDETVDVDVLGARVRRAATLIRICRGRIERARVDVEEIVAELADATPTIDDDDEAIGDG